MRPTWQVVENACGPCAAWGPIAVASAQPPGPADSRIPGRALRFRSASCSLRGARRTNADWPLERPPLFGIADGFGASPLAGTLSRVACHEAARLWEAGRGLPGAIEQANRAVRTVQDLAGDRGCGTTLVLAELLGGAVDLAWVGDSAALLIRPGENCPRRLTTCERTQDARLCSALGVARPLVRAAHAELAPGDIVALATDGVWEPLGDDLAGILAGDRAASGALDLRAAAERACREAVGRGGDNASIVLVAVD